MRKLRPHGRHCESASLAWFTDTCTDSSINRGTARRSRSSASPNPPAKHVEEEGVLGEIGRVVAHDAHSAQKEAGVHPGFLGWLPDRNPSGAGPLFAWERHGPPPIPCPRGAHRPKGVTAVTQQFK